jgi:predicted O-methyltransferase YrrM
MESLSKFNFNARIHLFTNQPPNAKCVEVGTRYGDLAYEAIKARPDLKLTVVDNWQGAFADGEQVTREKLRGFDVVIEKNTSVEAAKFFNFESLDFIYIDAAHDYANVTADIEAWWPKVKKGGILSGHDYETKLDDGFWGPIEVKQAVDDWAKAHNLEVHVVEPESCPSWWVVKR